jgi:hypothetical protein
MTAKADKKILSATPPCGQALLSAFSTPRGQADKARTGFY